MSQFGACQALILALILLALLPACGLPVNLPQAELLPAKTLPPGAATPSNSTGAPTDASTPAAALPAWTAFPSPPITPTSVASPTPLPSPTVEQTPLAPHLTGDRTRYRLQATLDYARHELVVEQTVVYTNTTPDALVYIPLMVEAWRYPGIFRLAGVYDRNGVKMLTRQEGPYLRLNLTEVLQPGDSLAFSLEYTLALLAIDGLPTLRSHPLGYTDQQVNFGDWYPYIPPYKTGVGWLAHELAYYGESLVYDVADFEVAIRLVGGQTDLVIAAPAPQVIIGEWRRYWHSAARNFAWSASPYYQVASETIELNEERLVTVSSYYLPTYQAAGESVLASTVQAVRLFSELYDVAYPHPVLAGVQASFLDGMEYDGLYFLGTDYYNWHKDQPTDYLVALAAHETAHQWFYGLVGNDAAMEPWLDEALCTYNERLFYENLYPDALDWWWTWRVNYYTPEGPVDTGVFDVPAVPGVYKEAYRDPVYLRGAIFLEELRMMVGDTAFFEALRAYVSSYAYRQASAGDFFDVFREHSNKDLAPLIEEYFSKVD